MGKISNLINSKTDIFLDSMYFIYYLDGKDITDELTELFLLAKSRKITIHSSEITLTEVLGHKSLSEDKVKIYTKFLLSAANLKLHPVNTKIILRAASLRRSFGLRLPDAIQLSTSIENRIEIFLTRDKQLLNLHYLPIKITSLN